jgi:two-component system, cell cycle sensor histidine kinase and response regulator CckA
MEGDTIKSKSMLLVEGDPPAGGGSGMTAPLRILHLEDDPLDAALIQSTLEAAGIKTAITRVVSREDFVGALELGGFDLILSDFSLPSFDGLTAAGIVRAKWPAIPLILVSGTLGEELAIESLKSGATDYVLKDRLTRLVPAVRRALKEAEQRRQNLRAQEALIETEQRLQAIFNESPLGIALVGEDGRPALTNAAFQKMLGYTGEELSRMHVTEFTHPDDCAKTHELHQEFTQGARNSYHVEKRYIRKDGQVVWVRVSVGIAHAMVGNPSFSIGMIEDITERRNLEAQFIEAQKMEVIGQLAGGVAHDFNNILGVIMGYCDLTIMKLGPDEEVRGYIETIRSAAERAGGLTRQLLIFSRKQAVQLVVLDLNEVVKDMNKMLRRLIDENVELKIIPGEHIGRIKADSGYIGQVLMNLVVNARDAMPNGGQLTVTTENATLDENYAKEHKGVKTGNYVMLSVSDTGTGMTEDIKARIFEAFFTTKPKGKGTGLGLATCQTIVQQSGGHIGLCSEVGRGTTFKIYFPRVELPLDVSAKSIQTGPLPRGTETLLVVEDEPSVRHLARSVLEAQGYHLLSASNGQDALHTVRDHKGSPIRLVVTDVIMPQMGGKVMAEWLRTANPDLKILFTSGYTDDAITQHGVLESGVEFLPKPYTPATLTRKVREMLDTNK